LIGNNHPSIFDTDVGIQFTLTFVKLMAWYGNDWSYSKRVCDLLAYAAADSSVAPRARRQTDLVRTRAHHSG
ncbi:uncharacterized protein B0H18DRAFT_871878, partial [Fomitopsis serialis]|uniref:uncharacterized protein n=1 Tax=Fomitopsis serialis TaxID=139415 RepID=UPI00200762A5